MSDLTKTATPGPWFPTLAPDRLRYTMTARLGEGAWTVSTDPRLPGWRTDSGHFEYGVIEADARLMAAAPRMLAALKRALIYVPGSGIGGTYGEVVAAIAEAEGASGRMTRGRSGSPAREASHMADCPKTAAEGWESMRAPMTGEQPKTAADYRAMSDGQLVTELGIDALKWAQAFCQITGFEDECLALAWFANALMAMHDHGRGPINGDHAQFPDRPDPRRERH